MNEKKSLQDILGNIAEEAGVTKKLSENFLRSLFEIVEEALNKDGIAKIPYIGTFKIVAIEERKSVNVQDGSEMIIPAHKKVSFTPEKNLKEEINKPYAHLETYVLKDDGPVDTDTDDDYEDDSEEEVTTNSSSETFVSNTPTEISQEVIITPIPEIPNVNSTPVQEPVQTPTDEQTDNTPAQEKTDLSVHEHINTPFPENTNSHVYNEPSAPYIQEIKLNTNNSNLSSNMADENTLQNNTEETKDINVEHSSNNTDSINNPSSEVESSDSSTSTHPNVEPSITTETDNHNQTISEPSSNNIQEEPANTNPTDISSVTENPEQKTTESSSETTVQPTINASTQDSTPQESKEGESDAQKKENQEAAPAPKTKAERLKEEKRLKKLKRQQEREEMNAKSRKWIKWMFVGLAIVLALLFGIKYAMDHNILDNSTKEQKTEAPVATTTNDDGEPSRSSVTESSNDNDVFEQSAPTTEDQNNVVADNNNTVNEQEDDFASSSDADTHAFDQALIDFMKEKHPELKFPSKMKIREEYVVKEGSRLAQISRNNFDNVMNFWGYIYFFNTDVLSSPSEVRSGMTLKIPDLGKEYGNTKSSKCKALADEVNDFALKFK